MLWIIDDGSGIRFEWNEAHTVNVFDVEGNNYDVFSIGDFARDSATLDEFKSAVVSYLANYELPNDVDASPLTSL